MLSPRAALAIVVAPFAVAALEWSVREAPSVPCGETDPREEWLAGLAPAAFVTGCVCLTVAVRISAMERRGRAGTPTLVAAAVWLVLAVSWWVGGASSPMSLAALLAYVLLVPATPVVLGLIVLILVRPSWRVVTGFAWLCAIVLVPGLVAVVENWGTDILC